MTTVFLGQIINTKSLNEFDVITNGFLAVHSNGKIIGIGDNYGVWKQEENNKIVKEIQLKSTQFLMPGFIDCHIHAPQFPQIGLGLDKTLLEWLNTYTFPLESNYVDEKYASMVYKRVVETTINNGTTMASYFATNHKNSSIILAKEVIQQGQRAFVGKVCSNCNCPDYYVETTIESISETQNFVNSINKLKSDLVKPIITPRFAVSCTKELMDNLGDIAKKNDLNIQSHISENLGEIELVKNLFGKTYAQVYFDSGLLTSKTIMAHAVYLDDSELELFKTTKTSVAHCPGSNTNLSSGLCDVKRILNAEIVVGLGTDVAGGNKASIHETILRCMDVSQHIELFKTQKTKECPDQPNQTQDIKPINYKQAIYLATLGGAEALSVDNITGNFKCDKDFDALLIDIDLNPINYIEIPKRNIQNPIEKLLEIVQKFIYCGDDRNIVNVFVKGKEIKLNKNY